MDVRAPWDHAKSFASHVGRASWPLVAAKLLIIFGAAFFALTLTHDYFAPGFVGAEDIGGKQIAALLFCAGCVGLGAVIEIVLKPDERASLIGFWAVAIHVAIAVLAFRVYELENLAFYEVVAPFVAAGFIIHHQLSDTWRKPFFFLLAVGCFAAVLVSANPVAAAWLFGLAGAIIVIASLPVPLWARLGLLAVAVAGCAALRAGRIETEWSGVIMPVLASMFMFRVLIYLYDRENGKGPKNVWQRLSYFFLPPNVVFPFFPVVDFATFGRCHYNEDAVRIYQRGAVWMVRGLVHLLLYRVVYLYGATTPESVDSAGGFLWHIVMNFGLYLRISGLFHLIIGMLLLFGYNLPETHTRFYFSNGFIDFWRRINIYWKDFMQKMVFNPVFVRLRGFGASPLVGIVVAMFAVFFATWALHAYQWFWLRGNALFTAPDMMFWGLLATLLVIQTLREAAQTPAAARSAQGGLLGPRAYRALRTGCTFLTICALWSLWSSESLADWGRLWIRAGLAPALGGAVAPGIGAWATTVAALGLAAFALAITLGFSFGLERPAPTRPRGRRATVEADAPIAATRGVAFLLALILVQHPALESMFGARAAEFVSDIRTSRLNASDEALLERGYYENLTNVDRLNSRLWEIYMARPNAASSLADAPIGRLRDDGVEIDYEPGASGVFNGVTYEINSWGMRDVEVAAAKPAGVLRIAIGGSSIVAGWGVELEDRFDKVLVPLLSGPDREDGAPRIETLNFAVDGAALNERLVLFNERAWRFEPDLVLFFCHSRDLEMTRFARLYLRGTLPNLDFVHDIVARARLSPNMSEKEAEARLNPFAREFVAAVFAYNAAEARRRGVPAVAVFLPLVVRNPARAMAPLIPLAEEGGMTVLDLSDVYRGVELRSVQRADWDTHPNAAGHRMIAARLARELRALDEEGIIDLGLAPPRAP
jgi:D-alanyl-lipoteichoic acid acyltransferase DltB (MBOAT superfamily)